MTPSRLFRLLGLLSLAPFVSPIVAAPPTVVAPPESFFAIVDEADRDAARAFYGKFIDLQGMPVVAAPVVDDLALQRTHEIVSKMLANRPDIMAAMVKDRMYLIIMGRDQRYTDMPEYRRTRNPDYMNERVRGTGGRPTSFGEENVLSLPLDRYDDESIGVHEFLHTIDGALRSLEPDWTARRNLAYKRAMDKGLWKFSYAASNPGEFWAEVAQCYFDCNRVNNWNHGPIGTREQLKAYDPETYALVQQVFRFTPTHDWRYTFLQKHPVVIAPPAKLAFPAHYTKFSWAREFPVLARDASDAAVLKANDTIRKMFAYRHDILKALIADGARLVVLGRNDSLSELPEFGALEKLPGFDPVLRMLDYDPSTKLVVVSEENVLGDPAAPFSGDAQLVRLFARAIHTVTASRPVDPNWEQRGRDVQQYELRVKRLDETFGSRLKELHGAALASGKWLGTAAVHGPADYFAEGVVAYFDAGGQKHPPVDAPHPIVTREQLSAYDPALLALVEETMAYTGHVDWRFRPHRASP